MAELMALEHLDEMCEDNLPIELLNDPAHPANDKFYETLNQLKAAINLQMVLCRPIEVEAAKLDLQGLTHVKVAHKLDVAAQSIGKYLKKKEVRRLQSLIRHLQHLLDGPNLDHRKNILYRIAIDNEGQRPSVSIQAIQEINKMSGAYEEKSTHGNTVNITINNELLPKGKLDELPIGMTIEGEVMPE